MKLKHMTKWAIKEHDLLLLLLLLSFLLYLQCRLFLHLYIEIIWTVLSLYTAALVIRAPRQKSFLLYYKVLIDLFCNNLLVTNLAFLMYIIMWQKKICSYVIVLMTQKAVCF